MYHHNNIIVKHKQKCVVMTHKNMDYCNFFIHIYTFD